MMKKETIMKRTLLSFAAASAVAMMTPSALQAATGDPVPHTFQSGTKAKAAEVNTNFQNLADRIANVAAQSGVAAATYDFMDFLPKGDLVLLYDRLIPQVVSSGETPSYQEMSKSIEWLESGEHKQFIARYKKESDGNGEETVKQYRVDPMVGFGLEDKRIFGIYGDDSSYLKYSIEWSEPLPVLPAEIYTGQTFSADGPCKTKSSSGVSTGCYSLAKITVLGIETVDTPAGQFTGCLKVLEEQPHEMIIRWFAPGMGMIKKVEKDTKVGKDSYDGSYWVSHKNSGWVLKSYTMESNPQVTVAGSVLLAPVISSATDIAKVVYLENGTEIATKTTADEGLHHEVAYSATDNGKHAYQIKIFNSFDELINTLDQTVEVAIATDVTPPSVTLAATPTSVNTTSSTQLDVSTDTDIARVEWLKDGMVFATDITAPYSVEVDYDALENGTHTYTARATDLAGNQSDSAAANVNVAMVSPNAAATEVNRAKALVNEIRAAGIETLKTPANTFVDEIELWEQTSSMATEHQVENLGRIVGMVTDFYLGKSGAEISGSGGTYTYDLSPTGLTGAGTITETVSGERVTYLVDGGVSSDSALLTLTFPDAKTISGPMLAVDISGWVGESTSTNRVYVNGGRVLLGMKQRLEFSEEGVAHINSGTIDLYVETVELGLDVDIHSTDGTDSFRFLGTMQLTGDVGLVNEMNGQGYDSYDGTWWTYYELKNDLLLTTLALDGRVDGNIDGENKSLVFKADAQFDTDLNYPPRTGTVKGDLGYYALSADGSVLTLTFANGETQTFSYILPSTDMDGGKIMVGGTLGYYDPISSEISISRPWNANSDWSGYSDVIEALKVTYSGDLGSYDKQLVWIEGEGGYHYTLDGNWAYSLSTNGGNIVGILNKPDIDDDPVDLIRSLNLSFGAKMGLLPEGRIGLSIQRGVYREDDATVAATVAYGETATEVSATVAELDTDNERLVGDVVIRSQDGVEIRLTEGATEWSGVIMVDGVRIGTVTEGILGITFTYDDTSVPVDIL